MFKIVTLLLLLISSIYGSINLDKNREYLNILPFSQIYLDDTNALGFDEIKHKEFKKNSRVELYYGFSPSFTLWVKFTLKNSSNKPIRKIVQYAHELTSEVWFFDDKRVEKRGFDYISGNSFALSPTFDIKLQANESKTFYIKAKSLESFLTVKLNLWDRDRFYKDQSMHQFILGLFFGALGLLILYNFFIFFTVNDKSYLLYVLYLSFILINIFFYRGFFYKFNFEFIVDFVKIFRITFPISILFLSLFIQSFLNTKEYPKIDKLLYLFSMPLLFIILVNFIDDFALIRFGVFYSNALIFYIFFIICYSAYRRNRQAFFILPGWLIMLISTLLIYLSVEGVYDFLDYFAYIIETGILFEALLFSFALADRIKILQKKLLENQKNQKQRLKKEVELKTKDLNLALNEKEILLRELLHRVKNNMQFITSLYALKLEGVKEEEIAEKLQDVERKVLAMSQVHQLLYNQKNIYNLEATTYFKKIVETIKNSFSFEDITFTFDVKGELEMEEAIYCGLIVNELVTNAMKYAFLENKGEITVLLKDDKKYKYLWVKDNGRGIQKDAKSGFGNIMIEALAMNQLRGEVKVDTSEGTKVEIKFPKKLKI